MELPADFAFYGTLRRGGGALERLGLDGLPWLGSCAVAGALYRVSWYPAFVPGAVGSVVADRFRIDDPDTIATIDAFEGFDPDDPGGSLYHRRLLPLRRPVGGEAWVYVWNRGVDHLEPVPSGDWLGS